MARTPYNGASRKLVLAFDIGTAYSGAAYAFLDPGIIPQINTVTRYLDSPNIGSSKVPSILYYDRDGNFRGVENGTGLQDDESLIQMRWWKMMLGPTELPATLRKHMSRELPRGKSIVDIFSDFMRYLFDSTKEFFTSSEQCAAQRWNSVSGSIELVLTHPNGWGGRQQSQLRTAAVLANIVSDTPEGRASVHFVTEGEANLYFCAAHTGAGGDLKHGDKVLVVDAGGTIDISSYVVTNNAPLQVEELFGPECLIQGGESVTARAREMVADKLKGSKFNTPEDISAFVQKFDDGLKRAFCDDTGVQFVKFGSPRDNDPGYGIKAGRLTLTGKQVSDFFEPSIQSTVDSIRENLTEVISMNSFVFLVGGFASSPWLANQLDIRLSDLGLKFFKPDTNTNKAVAVGAISYHIGRSVEGRITKFTYGTTHDPPYDPLDPEHVKRGRKTYINLMGEKRVRGAFTTMLLKGTKVLESQEIRATMQVVREGAPDMRALARIVKYDGNLRDPQWVDVDQERFGTLCHVAADVSTLPLKVISGKSGKVFFSREYDVVLFVGLVELKAQIRWIDSNGKERSHDAAIVYGEESEDICDDGDAAIVHGPDEPEDSRDDTRVVSPPTSGKISANNSLLSAVFSWESD